MEEAEYCHRLALMNRGRLIALDTPGRPCAPDSRSRCWRSSAQTAPRCSRCSRATPAIRELGLFGRAVHAVVDDAAAAEQAIRARSAAAGIALAGIARIAPSLEDVFIARVHAEGGAPQG